MISQGDLIEELLHLRYKPRRDNFKGCMECPAFDHFDWVVWTPDAKRFLRFNRIFPRYVLCLAHQSSLDTLLRLSFLLRKTILVVAGEDTSLSELQPSIDKLAPHCLKILFEAKDVRHPTVTSFSMGFISYYLRRLGDEALIGRIDDVRREDWRKEGVLAAWGGIWKYLDDVLDERREAAAFVEQSDWLQRVDLSPEEYVQRLSESKYMLAPAGAGVQAPKLAEAWLLRAVPIVIRNPCFEDLMDAGYPMLMIDKWSDLTPALLESHESTRRKIEWDTVEEMLTLRYFVRHVLGKAA